MEATIEFGGLPTSDPNRQAKIDEMANERAMGAREESENKKKEMELEVEKERGFPSGLYDVRATYPHRSGEMKETFPHMGLRVTLEDTREDVFANARSWTSMAGLHNFGMKFDKNIYNKYLGKVKLELVRDGKVYAGFDVLLDNSGHIVKE